MKTLFIISALFLSGVASAAASFTGCSYSLNADDWPNTWDSFHQYLTGGASITGSTTATLDIEGYINSGAAVNYGPYLNDGTIEGFGTVTGNYTIQWSGSRLAPNSIHVQMKVYHRLTESLGAVPEQGYGSTCSMSSHAYIDATTVSGVGESGLLGILTYFNGPFFDNQYSSNNNDMYLLVATKDFYVNKGPGYTYSFSLISDIVNCAVDAHVTSDPGQEAATCAAMARSGEHVELTIIP